MCIITNHGENRTKERVGISKKLSEKNSDKALRYGIKHSDVVGSLKRFLDRLYFYNERANNMRIYNQKVYLFHNEVLITIINLPVKYHKTIEKIKTKTRKE